MSSLAGSFLKRTPNLFFRRLQSRNSPSKLFSNMAAMHNSISDSNGVVKSSEGKAQSEQLRAMIGPSLLASDLSAIADESRRVLEAGADYLHLDVMDGHFVPNLTFGAPVIKSLRKNLEAQVGAGKGAYLDVHLMVSDPAKWVDDMAAAGTNGFTFHLESLSDDPSGVIVPSKEKVFDLIQKVKAANMHVGIAIKPKTPAEALFPYLEALDLALVMTVEPGFGGQKFMEDMMPKVRMLREEAKRVNPSLNIEVDGGLAPSTIDSASTAGANWIVAGSSVFKAERPADSIAVMKSSVQNAIASD